MFWRPEMVQGIGQSNSFYFLSNEVVRADPADGFHRNERPLVGQEYNRDGARYMEFSGFKCANRNFRVSEYIYN